MRNRRPPGFTATDCRALASHLANATALRTLRIRGLSGIHHTWEQPGLQAAGMRALVAALPDSLEVLEISGHNIGDEGATLLAEALNRRPARRLTELNLALNSINDAGAAALAGALQSPLARLTLDHNWIGASGAEALAKALRDDGSIRHISLASNDVGERGGAALATALRSNRALESLNLYANSIGTPGAVAFAATLAGGASGLTQLGLAHNYIDADGEAAGAVALADAMRRGNRRLRKLDLRWNFFKLCRCGSPTALRRAARAAPNRNLELVLERKGADD